jgi:methylated-DNA-protein-cysteine methyltransferase-like protein
VLQVATFVEVYKLVKKIPRGRVLTYGLISDLLTTRLSAQGVGWALKALRSPQKETVQKKTAKIAGKRMGHPYNSDNVPWHRVVNSNGGISTHKISAIPPGLQKRLLRAEGITFDAEDKIDLNKFLWMEGLPHVMARRKK